MSRERGRYFAVILALPLGFQRLLYQPSKNPLYVSCRLDGSDQGPVHRVEEIVRFLLINLIIAGYVMSIHTHTSYDNIGLSSMAGSDPLGGFFPPGHEQDARKPRLNF